MQKKPKYVLEPVYERKGETILLQGERGKPSHDTSLKGREEQCGKEQEVRNE